MSRFVDAVVAYRILRLLATPIERSDAYRFGIIDKDGNKVKDPQTSEEMDSYSLLQRFVFKVQRALVKSPDRTAKRLLTFAAAMAILREQSENIPDDELETLLEMYMDDESVQRQATMLENNLLSFKNFKMDEMMSAGAGGVAGIGIGPQGEPGRDPVFMPMTRRKKKRRQKNGNSGK
jgi:hypothetical protein